MDCEASGKNGQVKINACERGETERDAEEVQSFHEANMCRRRSMSRSELDTRISGTHASRVLASASSTIANFSESADCSRRTDLRREVRFGATPKPSRAATATQSHLPPYVVPRHSYRAMLDIRLIREKPDFVRERLATRNGGDEAKIEEVLRIDAERRKSETELQRLQSERNRLSKEIGARRSRKEPSEELEAEVRKIGEQIAGLTQRANALDEEQRNLLLDIPNLPHESVPIGKDPSANRVVRNWGEKPQLTNAADHVAIGTRLNLFNLEWAAKLSGSGFICFTGAGARLERALINFLLDLHTREHGYFEVSPPFLVRRDCMIGTTQLPKFEADMYGLEENQLFLAPTAEVQLTNLHREEILSIDDLPKKFTAYTPCFRREAGSAGRDTRGIIRVHQFDKVELVKIVAPEKSYEELESLTADAERVLQLLGLHYRVIELVHRLIWDSARPKRTTSKSGRPGPATAGRFSRCRAVRTLKIFRRAGCSCDSKIATGKTVFATR